MPPDRHLHPPAVAAAPMLSSLPHGAARLLNVPPAILSADSDTEPGTPATSRHTTVSRFMPTSRRIVQASALLHSLGRCTESVVGRMVSPAARFSFPARRPTRTRPIATKPRHTPAQFSFPLCCLITNTTYSAAPPHPCSPSALQFSSGKSAPAGARIVYIDGAFDLFHVGHVEILKASGLQFGCFVVLIVFRTIVRHIASERYERVCDHPCGACGDSEGEWLLVAESADATQLRGACTAAAPIAARSPSSSPAAEGKARGELCAGGHPQKLPPTC